MKTLLSGDPLLKRSDVIREIGEGAFDYGLLIGHEDFRLIRDETADIFVTFPHRSIQEFLGVLYFIWMLNKGKTVQYLVGSDCVKPIFLTNPLFLQFCLWFLWDDQTYFNFEKRHTVYKCLIQFSLNLMNCRQLDMTPYPVFHISSADITWGKLGVRFLVDILVNCNKTSTLILPPGGDVMNSILGKISPILKAITRIKIAQTKTEFHVTFLKANEMIIKANCPLDELSVDIILKYYTKLMNEPTVQLYLDEPEYPVVKFSYPNVKNLYMINPRFENTIELSPQLTQVYLKGPDDESIINKLADAVSANKSLSHLSLSYCHYHAEGRLPDLFKSELSHLKHLDLRSTDILETDLEFLCLTCNGLTKTLPNLTSLGLAVPDYMSTDTFCEKLFILPWPNLNSLYLYGIFDSYKSLANAVKNNKLQNLTYFKIGTNLFLTEPLEIKLLSLDKLANLQFLHLDNCQIYGPLEIASSLSELSLLHCDSLRGNLSSLSFDRFTRLKTLILSNGRLN